MDFLLAHGGIAWEGDREYMSIELKNINLDGITQQEQINKIYEEVDEFSQGVVMGDLDNSIEEFFDVVQAGLGALQKMGLSADYVMSQYPKHLSKIKDRPRVKEKSKDDYEWNQVYGQEELD